MSLNLSKKPFHVMFNQQKTTNFQMFKLIWVQALFTFFYRKFQGWFSFHFWFIWGSSFPYINFLIKYFFNFSVSFLGLEKFVHSCDLVHTVYAKAVQHTWKNGNANFDIFVISKVLERYFTELFYYCFIETYFVVHS